MSTETLGHLVLVLHPDEPLHIGDAVIRCTVRADGKIQIYIEAPKSLPVLRQSAVKRVAG